jgi:hypothetical protein
MTTITAYDDDGFVTALTETTVNGWISARERLDRAVDDYIRIRNNVDPKFKCKQLWRSDGSRNDDVEIEYDVFVRGGAAAIVEWSEYQCGTDFGESRTIDLSHLWSPDVEETIRSELEAELARQLELKRIADATEKEAQAVRDREKKEREYATWKRLNEVYGEKS